MPMIYDSSALDPRDPLQAAVASRDRDVPAMVTLALAEGRTQLAFQPIVRPGQTHVVAFHEALIRVLDEGGRILPAGQFLPDVEETSLGRDLDCESLRLSIEMLRKNPSLRLAVNMSARSIADGRWRQILTDGLRRVEVGPRLILEISEQSAMLIPEVVIRFMAEVQPRGVAFALDDFGAGLTAFRYLKDFFFDLAKIDSHFVNRIDEVPDNQVLAEALITVAHQFEMFVVAEGVERQEEADMLESLGVDCLQGYLFGVPKPTL
ncbi:EAL domain-containing protein [Ponticoccus sp. SC2-23]|uniref:EAL domain-containing protein n=1 Tax=Alexandriicola marinus TaxID=2081710 RepID=UPI000FD6F9D1|nr:EAL domain-containing protein [Alexandriicola marinus]MBM1220379.1 EAL domain-containing protein [Ponticoccus sp. SC6-9]MBM1225065.1 EAL domain-containing protein [Ponticoccus sp. SC6-15]MBM1228579.1 EAL domain-containing protein [Ponticoccus sp. SC6-38]MBM1233784.1 EAL domain-containing protein [Ponticoccus sp. SC6-45]MBM1239080.1 EAL domain-containing protein [Ponticoccus sp. SC6-49]MBM1242862.1 EAL domain-containing protein [Ponticoccus sp. SC2-64]MBM1247308.1 EAL domain-containing pro